MSTLPVNAIFAGMQTDGHWAGAPTLIIQLMEHPGSDCAADESLDGSYPVAEWTYDPANEISMNKLLTRRRNAVSPHFACVGAATLGILAASYREPHVMIIGRDPGRHDLAPLVSQLLAKGRSVQIETTVVSPALAIPDAWITLLALPSRPINAPDPATHGAPTPNEIIACIRWKADLERAEMIYARSRASVWLRPSPTAEDGIYRQCIAVATRNAGWRVIPPFRLTSLAA